MNRMRSIAETYQLLKEEDPGTKVTVCMLRRLVADGIIPSVRSGRKILLNYDTLSAYLSRPYVTGTPHGNEEIGSIRPVELHQRQ